MPLVRYREPRRGDIVVFIRPAPEPEPDPEGNPQYLILVKRLIGIPGDHIHLHEGVVYVNGVAQPAPKEGLDTPAPPSEQTFLDEFPAVLPTPVDTHGAVDTWVVELAQPHRKRRPGGAAGQVLHDGRSSPRQHGFALLGLRAAGEHHGPAAVQLLVIRDS